MASQSPLVVKVGGGAGIDLDLVCDEIAALVADREIVLVHGGSQRTNEVAAALGHPPRFVTSPSGFVSRLTDRATLEIFEMVYCGQVNKSLVERLIARGVTAIGLSGIDGRLWQGTRKDVLRVVEDGRTRIIRDNYTGRVERVNRTLLDNLLTSGYLPVLTPPAISFAGEAMNVDGDRAAAATAAALGASELVILSNVPGLLADFPDPTTRIPYIRPGDLEPLAQRHARGRMRIKLLAAAEALACGVQRVLLGDATAPRPVARALAGEGTVMSGEWQVASGEWQVARVKQVSELI
jgi:acetylglutamate/LysW-gamma-L-alpha-aminoadipate kinase